MIRLFLLMTSLRDLYHHTTCSVSDLFSYLKDYYYGYHDIWLFVTGHSVPISLNNFYNISHVSWIYNNGTTTLEKSVSDNAKESYKLSWLSAKVLIQRDDAPQEEYDMDDFLGALQIKTTRDCVPTLNNIFHAWCAYKKHWFQPHCTIEFYIIDEMGQDRVLELVEHNFCLLIQGDKITMA
jgi:hypothetical protein